MEHSIIFLLAGLIVLAAILFGLVSFLGRKSHARIDVSKYRIKYLEIENQLSRDNPASYPLTVINADKLVDQAMQDLKLKGNTMGERLKSAGSKFSQIDNLWQAHKLRNQIVHQDGFEVDYKQSQQALSSFRRALKDLGAI